MISGTLFEILRKKFYEKAIYFKNFAGINEDEIARIKELVKKEEPNFKEKIENRQYGNYIITKFIYILQYLCSHNLNDVLPTYDMQIIFLIFAIDPNLQMYRIYQENIKSEAIDVAQTTNKIREKFGFYDRQLLEYEAKYIKRFILKFNQKSDLQVWHKFQLSYLSLKDFQDLNSDDNNRIILKAEDYLTKYGKPSHRDLSYQLFYQPHLLDINTDLEKTLFFILVMDKDLRMLQIYETGSTWKEIENRIREEFGFFSKKMVLLEKKYQQQFYPDLDIAWDNNKEI